MERRRADACSTCGLESSDRRRFDRHGRCLPCAARERYVDFSRYLRPPLVTLVVGVVAFAADRTSGFGPVLVCLSLSALSIPLFLVVNEIGRALVSRFIGLRVAELALGVGRVRFMGTVGQTRWVVRRGAWTSRVLIASSDASGIQYLLSLLAGPATSALLVALSVVWMAHPSALSERPFDVWWIIFCANAYVLGADLFFVHGRRLLQAVRYPTEFELDSRASGLVVSIWETRRRAGPEQALAAIDDAVAGGGVPSGTKAALELDVVRASLLSTLQRYDEAGLLFERAAQSDEAHLKSEAHVGLAWIAMEEGDPLGRAKYHVSEAFALGCMDPQGMATAGAALLSARDLAWARSCFEAAQASVSWPSGLRLILAGLAVVLIRQGDEDGARRLFEQHQQLGDSVTNPTPSRTHTQYLEELRRLEPDPSSTR